MQRSEPQASLADRSMLEDALARLFAPSVRELGMRVLDARAGEVPLELPVTALHLHAGGVLCGCALLW